MNVSRRRVIRGVGAASTGAIASIAGCSSFERTAHLLVTRNDTDSTHTVTIVIRRATTGTTTTTTENATTTVGTSPRYVVELEYELGPGDRREAADVLPENGAFEVVATVPDVGTARGSYTDEESVRVTIQSDGVTVETFTT